MTAPIPRDLPCTHPVVTPVRRLGAPTGWVHCALCGAHLHLDDPNQPTRREITGL